MNKSIACLLVFGFGLAVLHSPAMVIHLSIITGLILVAVKVFWSLLQVFAAPSQM
ncbi:MAG: hypothetical protein AB8B99_25175 [Phormidesmis sp.]